MKKPKKPSTPGGTFVEMVLIVAIALGLALGIQAFLVKPYRIPSASMEPTLNVGQRVLVNRVGERFSSPSVGDIVVFHPPRGAEDGNRCGAEKKPGAACAEPTDARADSNFIKRVVGGPGDLIAVKNGHVIRNGKLQKEPFTRDCGAAEACNLPTPIRIPADHYFMMGDNRGESDDSRFWGPVPEKWIIGGAFATYWPPKRVGLF